MEGGTLAQISRERVQDALTKGTARLELENRAAQGLIIDHLQKGFMRFTFVIPPSASDANGNWQVGAMATIIDLIASMVIFTETGTARGQVTMDYNISCYSAAKTQEEVEIDAKVIGNKGKLTSVAVEVRRKYDGELIAAAKQWTAFNQFKASWTVPRTKL
ncbi:uncharacterized protein LOC120131579 [Hibiscus syriacus]|uniref:uncharacterized protein LOC120131579 n=1 Tax=Hibiscus syriacus TaxID=106335 RepID=UPI0019224659|nr:uncharacterized protein LOC120131579 [Hibiscus syriacus]